MLAIFPRVSGLTLRPTRTSLPSTFLRCRYATKPAAKAPSGLKMGKVRGPSIAPSERLIPRLARQQHRANQMFDRGVRNIYKAPSHVGMLTVSWSVGLFLFSYTVFIIAEGGWAVGDRMQGAQKMITEAGYRLGMIVCGFVGGYALIRYNGLIKSIDLVARGGKTQLQLSVRRMIPFLQPKRYIVPPHDLLLPDKWDQWAEDFGLGDADLRRRTSPMTVLRTIFVTPLLKLREWILMNTVISVRYLDGDRKALLDLKGDFSNRGADLMAVTDTETQR